MVPRRTLALLLGLLTLGPALGQAPIGFRTDGTGRYPAAEPPLAWGPDRNVVWKTKLPPSNAIPVLLGDRIFTCAEPCVLLCLNKADGTVLWRHESYFKEIEPTAEERARIEAEGRQDAELAREQAAVEKELGALRKALKDANASKAETDEKTKPVQKQADEVRARRKALTTLIR